MALFGIGKKRQPQPEQAAAPGTPIEQIMVMKQQGLDNNQIVQELERQGYNSSQIFDALNQINISGASAGSEQPPDNSAPPQQQDFSYEQPFPEQQMPEQVQPEVSIGKEQIEEIAEAIIDEKWKEFEQDVGIIIEWKEKTEARMGQIEQQIKDVANSVNSIHKNIINKISEYDRSITDVGTEIKAMEKVFQKVLPSLTENVNKLDRMTKGSKLSPRK